MSGFLDRLKEQRQEFMEQREERREALHERHGGRGRGRGRGSGGLHHADDDDDNYGSQRLGQRPYGDGYNDQGPRGPQSYSRQDPYQSQSQPGVGGGYAPPSGPPPHAGRGPAAGFAVQGGLDRGDFASDADIDRMLASGELGGGRQGQGQGQRQGRGYGYGEKERENASYGRYDAPSGPPPGSGYGERANVSGRYDAPSGPPSGRGYQSQQSHQQGYGTGGGYAPSYDDESDRRDQYGSQQTHGRTQRETPQGPPSGQGRAQGNAPSGGFTASRDQGDRYGSGNDGASNDRNERPRRGEAAGYYEQQGGSDQGDRYAHLASMAQEHGQDDPELYRRATQGLQERIQSQAKSGRPRDDERDYNDAHQKAYGGDDHGPMDADTIGAAAAMEAFKQAGAGAGSSNAPAGAFKAGKAGGASSSKPGREEEEEEDTAAAARAGGSGGGLQDKLMALAMSHAGKLFDKKNAGSNGGGDPSQGKAQAMQSAAATAMQLFTKYQGGKLDSSDMSSVMTLAMKML